jgi:hypothetical protein
MGPADARGDVGDRPRAVRAAERPADDERGIEGDARDADAVVGQRADRARHVRSVTFAVGAVAVAHHAVGGGAAGEQLAGEILVRDVDACIDDADRRAAGRRERPEAVRVPERRCPDPLHPVQGTPLGVVRCPERVHRKVRLRPANPMGARQLGGHGCRVAGDADEPCARPGDRRDRLAHSRLGELAMRRVSAQPHDHGVGLCAWCSGCEGRERCEEESIRVHRRTLPPP